MLNEDKLNLLKYRLANANEKIVSAKLLLEAGQFKDSIGRSYYAMFSAVRAILACDEVDYSKHSGVIAYFQKNYIKEGILEKKYSKYIQNAFQVRNTSEYDDFYIVSKEAASTQYERAVEMLAAVKEYLRKEYGNYIDTIFDTK